MSRWGPVALAVCLVALVLAVLAAYHWQRPDVAPDDRDATVGLPVDLDERAGEFPAPADGPLRLPDDHATKPEQFAEYWLFAGQLQDDGGAAYGFQLMLTRVALQKESPASESAWAARDLFRGHLVLAQSGHSARGAERFQRAALDLSGASEDPVRVWVEDWRVGVESGGERARISARDGHQGLQLQLDFPTDHPTPVDGQEQRGYWWPGLRAEGTLTQDGEAVRVQGEAIMDRLWGRGLPIGRGQLALARLWLTLDDGRAVRCRQLRRPAGGGTPLGECLVRAADGATTVAGRRDVHFEPKQQGRRSLDGLSYPLRWSLVIEGSDVNLDIRPYAEPHSPFVLALWSGLVTLEDGVGGWGVLELSNFGSSAMRGDRGR